MGFAYCNTFPQEGTVPWVPQITENKLCQEHWNNKKTHFHDNQENLRTAVLWFFPLRKTLFLTKVILFKELSKIFKDFCGKSKDFQEHDAFSRTFQGPCEPCLALHLLPGLVPRVFSCRNMAAGEKRRPSSLGLPLINWKNERRPWGRGCLTTVSSCLFILSW